VTSPTKGVAIANIDDAKAWTLAKPNPFTLVYTTNMPNAIFHVSGDLLYGCCDSGIIVKSIDGGNTWTVADNGVATASDLDHLYFANEDYGYFVGASGAAVRYYKGEFLAVTSGSSAQLNDVAIPPGRPDEVYIASADGYIYKSTNGQTTNLTVTFAAMSHAFFGTGSINKITFVGYNGHFMYVIQSEADADSRVYRDLSGGAFTNDVEVIGDYQTPSNNGYNWLACKNENFALVAGEIETTYGYIGKIS
jgi:hypothetical protein